MIRRFNRFELKYVIGPPRRDALADDMRHQMRLDPHGGDGTYRVTSLYYDSPDDACFRAKVDGIKFRRKVRIRTYGASVDDPRTDVHLEIKQRINRTVQKRRCVLPLQVAEALVEGRAHPELEDPRDRAVVEEVSFLSRSLNLRPACVISYLRQAWVGSEYEPGLRVTFDQVLAVRGPERHLGAGLPSHLFMTEDWMIMEVKADEAIPIWVTRMLARHQCSLQRLSKYCSGISHLRSIDRTAELRDLVRVADMDVREDASRG